MQLLQERIGREIQLLVSYRAEVYELQQRIFAYVEQLPTISRISQDTQARTFRENHIKGFHLEHATAIKSDNGIFLFRADGNGIVHALLRIGMTSLNPKQLLRILFLFACHDLYLSIAPCNPCLAVFLQHQVQAYGSPIVQSKVWILIVICAIIPCFMFTTAKIMQTSAMKACFQIAECSLSYAKLQVRCVKSWRKRENYLKNLCITLYQ